MRVKGKMGVGVGVRGEELVVRGWVSMGRVGRGDRKVMVRVGESCESWERVGFGGRYLEGGGMWGGVVGGEAGGLG
jgi:hypothetical protein